MGRISSTVRTYKPFFINDAKERFAYKSRFFIFMGSNFLTMLVTYYLWRAIFSSSTTGIIQGFAFPEMATYVLIGFLTNSMVWSDAIGYVFDIMDGSIAISLIRPISYFGSKLAEQLGKLFFNAVVVFIPFTLIFSLLGLISFPGFGLFVLYLVSMLLSAANMMLFNMCFSVFGFYTTYFFGFNLAEQAIVRVLSGMLIPLSFFPAGVEAVLRLLPFAGMTYTPLMVYLGKLQGPDLWYALGLQLVWAVILALLARVLWAKAFRRLTILGG